MNARLTELKDANNLRTGWKYYEAATENTELYNATGRLQSITTRAGVIQTLAYNAANQLTTVTDSYARTLTFTYNAANAITGANNIATVTDHLGNVVSYTYDAANNLATVIYPGGGTKTYLYNEPAFTANNNLPNALTGITDENGTRFATYQYDAQGRAISTEHAGGVEKYSLNYTSPYAQTVVTDPLGTQRTYNFQTILGVVKTTGVSQPCPSCGGTQSQATTYDINGNISSRTDFNGVQTTFTYDLARNLELSRTEAAGTANARTFTTTWHATYRLPLTITEPAAAATVGGAAGVKTTAFTYDASGNALTKKVTAPKNDGTAATELRTWTWTYNALGQVLTAKDPLNRVTTTAYYAATDTASGGGAPKFTVGDVQTVTNAAGHITTFNEYDKNGRLLKMTDPNGLITTMSYHPRGWLTSRAVANGVTTEITTYTYDNVGQLISVVTPDGVPMNYTYDAAHRLVRIWDESSYASSGNRLGNGGLGNRIDHVLDNMGNRISESHYDPTGALQKKKTRVIDSLNRLQQDIGGTTYATAPAQAISQYGYDNNGNLTSTTDPLSRVTTNNYDALNRLVSVIDPYNGAGKPTVYAYDNANNLTRVTDPEGKATDYTYNGHNNLITQASPDTGTTKFTYNAVGNVVTKLDAAGRCSLTSYDTLNRATAIRYFAATNATTNTAAGCAAATTGTATVAETVAYTYDSITATVGGAGGKGRLGQFTDGTGNTKYVYDKNGRILSKAQTITGATNATQTVTYAYNANGQLVSMTSPSGQTLGYVYNASSNNGTSTAGYLGRISAITLNGSYVIGFAQYQAFGPASGWAWGNHQSAAPGGTYPNNLHSRLFDLDYRPTAIFSDPEGYNRNINWDQANRITGITVPSGLTLPGVSNAGSLNQAFAYDTLDRLTTFNAGVTGATNAATGLGLLPAEAFTYDGIGNRKTRSTQAPGATSTQSTSYVHGTTNHWLQSSTGQNPNTYTLDVTGNTLTESNALATMNAATGQLNPIAKALSYTYDAKNRLSKVQIGATPTDTVTYKINALGQRVQKTGAGVYAYSTTATINTTTGQSPQSISLNFNARYVYDEQGRLIGEYSPEGKLIAETIWFNDLPVATLRPKGSSNQLPLGITGTAITTANNTGNNTPTNKANVDVYYVHPDHLGTPRVVTRSVAVGAATTGPNAINKQVWSANTDPFGTSLGNSAPNENPQLVTGTATQVQAATFRQNLRFPGQVADGESGKAYNYFRDYDPQIGRYSESDPIGLKGGLSAFGYVGANPIFYSDPYGLDRWGGEPRRGRRSSVACAVEAARQTWLSSQTWPIPTFDENKTPWNAMLHCVGSCEIGNRCGTAVAFAAGWFHEAYDGSRPGRPGPPMTRFPAWDDPVDSWNDIENNESGRDCSKRGCKGSSNSCYQCCWLKLVGGRLAY